MARRRGRVTVQTREAKAKRMGERLPRITGKELVAALRRLGFELHHARGSHHVLRSAGGAHVTVPVHAGAIVGLGLLRRILEQAGVTDEELRRVL